MTARITASTPSPLSPRSMMVALTPWRDSQIAASRAGKSLGFSATVSSSTLSAWRSSGSASRVAMAASCDPSQAMSAVPVTAIPRLAAGTAQTRLGARMATSPVVATCAPALLANGPLLITTTSASRAASLNRSTTSPSRLSQFQLTPSACRRASTATRSVRRWALIASTSAVTGKAPIAGSPSA